MSKHKTLVLGATENPSRYANMAIRKLRNYGHEVAAVGRREGEVLDVPIETDVATHTDDIDTVTLYLNPNNQQPYYDYLLSLNPRRVIFNPGTENPELENKLRAIGTEPIEACTLVMLSTGQY